VYLGIDWSQLKHDYCLLDEQGRAIQHGTIPHRPEGFETLDQARSRIVSSPDECWVGLETAHNIVIDWLWARGYSQVYVIPPGSVNRARGRYRQTNAHNDQSDAYVIADMVRTDQARLVPWHPDSALTRQLRAKVGLLGYLTREIVRTGSRLEAVLARYYPAALQVFKNPRVPLNLQFIQAFPTPTAAEQLNREEFKAFLRARQYRQPEQTLLAAYARLHAPYPEADPATIAAYRDEAVLLAGILLAQLKHKQTILQSLAVPFAQHPDQVIFASLPGTGPYLGPALLAKFGDDRARFPTAASVQALAGTCPVTEASGKRRQVKFRHACDHEFRQIVVQWAKASLGQSVWAASYWEQLWPRCHSTSHAYRCLANRWLAVAWKCWQARTPYDERYHLQRHAQRAPTRSDILIE
jgi:transposase